MSPTRQILPQPCSHLTDFRSKHGSQPFRVVQKCLRVRPLGRAEIRRDPLEVPRCASCGASASSRLYACIACASLFCHSPKLAASHAAQHASPGHEIAVDIDRAELFCCVCCDQVYDREFDTGVVLAQQRAASSLSLGGQLSLPVPQEKGRKRMRLEHRPWRPDPTEELLVTTGSTTLHHKSEGESSASTSASAHLPWGLRGLNNLGSTCFMNSVLQALLHAPPLRDYFLSDRHNRYICHKKANSSGNGISNGRVGSGNVKNSNLCLACDMDALFSAVFSGDRMPYSPAKFLYSWWQHAANLASYEQQDAHEFFISMLDGIHEKVKERGKFHDQGNGTCCIAHRVFSGILRSDVTCTACGFTSTTYDPCVDISLDLEPNKGGPAKASVKPQQALNGGGESTTLGQHSGVATLLGCLDHFTRPERLGSDQKFFCQQCQVRQESLKQMSIRKLPLVSCFHIKRFEHSSTRKTSRKVDRYLQFPFSLDMSSYVSSSILRSRFGNRIVTLEDDESNSSNDIPTEFELFAVVTHTGTLDSGHYVTYLRLNNQWYKCDDAWISQVSESIVRAAQAYMMFYVQKVLYFKASERFLATDPAVN